MRYRDHKPTLDESMKTVINVSSVDDIKNHLKLFYADFNETIEEIKFSHIGMDYRIGWDTYHVLFRLSGKSYFSLAGMSDGCF